MARYWGESGDSGYHRTSQHVAAIRRKDEENAFAKHLAIHHPGRKGDTRAFKFTLEEVHGKPLPRLFSERAHVHKNRCEETMNRKPEWQQPVVARVVVTRELEELKVRGARRICRHCPLSAGLPRVGYLERAGALPAVTGLTDQMDLILVTLN